MPVLHSVSYVAKIASVAKLSEKTKRYAVNILKKAEQKQLLAGKDPTGMAAAALYLASLKTGEHITQKDISLYSEITDVTVRNRCKTLKELNI
jgi:transcription initiation factor TFIIB